jgi:hypothetical protein
MRTGCALLLSVCVLFFGAVAARSQVSMDTPPSVGQCGAGHSGGILVKICRAPDGSFKILPTDAQTNKLLQSGPVKEGSWYCPPMQQFYPKVTKCLAPWAWSEHPSEAMRRLEMQRQANAQGKKQEETAAVQARQQEADSDNKRREEVAEQAADDARLGYNRTTIADFLVRYPQVGFGAKVVITGIERRDGHAAELAQDNTSDDIIYMDTSALSPDTQKLLVACRQTSSVCQVTIWAHTGCAMMAITDRARAPCLIVDGLKNGTYEYPTSDQMLR